MRALVVSLLIAIAVLVGACGDAMTTSPPPAAVAGSPSPSPSATARPTPRATVRPTPTPLVTPRPTASSTATSAATTGATHTEIDATKTVRYFMVYGNSPQQLLASVVARSRSHCGTSDTLACVRQSRIVDWNTVTSAGTDACRITSVAVTLKSVVWLPKWVKPSNAPRALVTWWGKMSTHFVWHENQHIAIEKRYEAKLDPLFTGKACSTARTTLKRWGKTANAAQAKFDAKDHKWPYPVYGG